MKNPVYRLICIIVPAFFVQSCGLGALLLEPNASQGFILHVDEVSRDNFLQAHTEFSTSNGYTNKIIVFNRTKDGYILGVTGSKFMMTGGNELYDREEFRFDIYKKRFSKISDEEIKNITKSYIGTVTGVEGVNLVEVRNYFE